MRCSSLTRLPLAAALCCAAHAGSILVPNAGVEVYQSWVALVEGFYSYDEVGSMRIARSGAMASFAYGLTGNVLLGLDVTTTEIGAGKDHLTAVEPDIRMKWNFWSKLSPGHYHRLALQTKLSVPEGDPSNYFQDESYTDANGSHLRFVQPRLVPSIDLIYSRATWRWVYGAEVGYSLPLADAHGLKLGNQRRAAIDAEYAFWRGEKSEASFVFGATARQVGRASQGGADFSQTGGSDVALSYGVQYAAMANITFEGSYTSDVWSVMRPGQPQLGKAVVFGIRYLK